MDHFKATVENESGGFDRYEKGLATPLGDPFGEQVPIAVHRGEQWVTVEFESGVVSRIPASRVLNITEM